MNRKKVYLGLGTNLGDRINNLNLALERLILIDNIDISSVSSLYVTAPIGYLDQSDFYNIAVMIETSLEPLQLLDICQNIEQELGRVRSVRWGPRTVDIDLLCIPDTHMESERLTLPHPRMLERAFVMVPLSQIAPNIVMSDGRTSIQVADSIKGQEVCLLKDDGWEQKWRCSDMKQ